MKLKKENNGRRGYENSIYALCVLAIFHQDRNTARSQCCKIKLPDSSFPTVIRYVYHHL